MGLFCYTTNMPRQALYNKDEMKNGERTVDQTRAERDSGHGVLRSYGGTARTMDVIWDFNEKAIEDGIVMLKIGKETALVDVNQLQKFLRWV